MQNPLKGLTRLVSTKNRYLIGVVSVCALSTGTLMATAPQHDPKAVEEKAWPVSTIEVSTQTLSPQLQLFGRVETPHHASLSAALEADVQILHVVEGQQVEQGQLLISLDSADEILRLQQTTAAYSEALASLAALEREHASDVEVLTHMRELYALTKARAERLQTLAKKNLVATEQLENTLQDVARQGIELARHEALVDNHPQRLARAEASVGRTRALRDAQSLAVERTRITAPFSGRIAQLSVAPGDRVTRGQPLVSLFDTDRLQVRVSVPAGAVPDLKRALAASTSVTARAPGANLGEMRLSHLAGEVVRGRSGVDALFDLPSGAETPELGRAVQLEVNLPAIEGVVALPVQSLYNDSRVYQVADGRLIGIAVDPLGQRRGPDGDLQILVSAPLLKADLPVLASDVPRAVDGLRVETLAERDNS